MFHAESTQFDLLRRELRSQGLDLQATKRIPENWVILLEESLPMGFSMQALVAPEYYSGYDADPFQQVVGGQGEAGINQQGIGVVLRGNGQIAKDIWLEGATLERQTENFDKAVKAPVNFLIQWFLIKTLVRLKVVVLSTQMDDLETGRPCECFQR